MLKRIPTLKGLNLRDSDINRPPDYAQDCRNVEKNSKGEVVLRWGYDKILDDNGIIDLFEYVGAINDPNRGSLLVLKGDGLYRLNGSSLDALPPGHIDTFAWTAKTKPFEYNKVLYWNDPDGNLDLWKFDGYNFYRAGAKKPEPTGSGSQPVGSDYVRLILQVRDPQGNVTMSDYFQWDNVDSSSINAVINNITDPEYAGFYQKYGTVADGNPNCTKGTKEVLGVSNHNYVVGDVVLAAAGTGYTENTQIHPLPVIAVTPTQLTFDMSGTPDGTSVTFDNTFKVDKYKYNLIWAKSSLPFSNYEVYSREVDGLGRGNSGSFFTTPSGTTTGPLQDVYDDSVVRILPPKMKHWTLYGEFAVGGFIFPDNPDIGFLNILGKDSRLEDGIVWSDVATLSNGSSIETFLINNIRAIGNSEDGALVGLHGNDDNLAVHKEKQSYYVNGDFISNNLRIRRAMTEQIGTASHRSIRTVEGGHLYASPKGIYLSVGGQRPTELSDLIEPLFTDNALELLDSLNTKDAKTITDFLREKMYIFIPYTDVSNGGIVLSYDYYHKDWFVHDNIPAINGFQDVGVSSTDIYFADGDSLYKRNLNSRKDDDKKTVGYYWTGWFDLDFPSIVKKFSNFILLSIAKKDFTATIKGYCNWQKDTEESSNTVELTDKISSEDTQVLQVQANSVSYRISNESNGSDLHITSYEVEYEPTQTKPKGTV